MNKGRYPQAMGGILLSALAFLVPFGVYLWRTCPTTYWRDTSELQWAGFALGVPHPPGSPTYMVLAKAASLLPLGSVGFRVNCLSGVTAALAVLLLYGMVVSITRRDSIASGPWALPAASAAFLLAAGPSFSLYAEVAEAYALGALGCAAVLLVAYPWFAPFSDEKRRDDRFAFASFFLLGVAAGLHISAGAYVAAILFAMAAVDRRRLFRPRMLFGLSFFLILGLAVFLFVPLRASAHPTINWGRPDTAPRLRYHLLDQKDWPPPRPAAAPTAGAPTEFKKSTNVSEEARPLVQAIAGWLNAPRQLLASVVHWHRFVLGLASEQLGLLWAPLALLGSAWLVVRRRTGLLLLLLSVAWGHGIFSAAVAQWGSPYGYFPVYLVIALLSGLGLRAIADFAGWLMPFSVWGRGLNRALPCAALAALVVLRNPPAEPGRGQYWSTYRFGMELFRRLPPRALVLAAHYWPILGYLHFGEGVRPDVNLLYRNEAYQSQQFYPDPRVQPDLLLPPEGLKAVASMTALLAANLPLRPILWQSEWDDPIFEKGLVPEGLWLRFSMGEGAATAGGGKALDEFFESWSSLIAEARNEGGRLDVDEREDLSYVPFRLGNFLLSKKDCTEARRWLDLSASLVDEARPYSWVAELRNDLKLAREGERGSCPGTGRELVDTGGTSPGSGGQGGER